jgi:hypothetical protein
MANVYLRNSADLPRNTLFGSSEHWTVASYERERPIGKSGCGRLSLEKRLCFVRKMS